MKGLKYFVITGFLTLSAFAAVTYTSCNKDACNGVTCLHKDQGATCSGGVCICPNGLTGVNCELSFREIYKGTYSGNSQGNAGHKDTVTDFTFVPDKDTTTFNTMYVVWSDQPNGVYALRITLTENTSNGSKFQVADTTFGNRTFSAGFGTVNKSSMSISLRERVITTTDTTVNQLSYSNFLKKP